MDRLRHLLISGVHIPLPGEVSLVHHGMFFLDERPAFRYRVLPVLLQPLEDSLTRVYFRGWPASQHSCNLHGTPADLEGLGPSSVAVHYSQNVSLASRDSGAVPCFSLDTGRGLEY
jgi:hypothetical protein